MVGRILLTTLIGINATGFVQEEQSGCDIVRLEIRFPESLQIACSDIAKIESRRTETTDTATRAEDLFGAGKEVTVQIGER